MRQQEKLRRQTYVNSEKEEVMMQYLKEQEKERGEINKRVLKRQTWKKMMEDNLRTEKAKKDEEMEKEKKTQHLVA